LFVRGGVVLPLQTIEYSKNGLLKELPCLDMNKKGWPWNEETDALIYNKNSSWPKLTIVMPSFNQGLYIEEAIRSVLLQNYPNIEFIIIDGGSTDNTKEVLEKYSKWVSFWQTKKDRGQGNAINLGFSIASGDYFGWLNSDDFYNRDALFYLANEIMKSKKDFYYGDAFSVNEDRSEQAYWKANLVLDRYLRFGGLIASHSAFWKRTIHKPIWEKMNCNVDAELWIRLVKGRSKRHIRFPLGTIRNQPNTKSANEKWIQKWKEDDDNIELLHGKPPKPRAYVCYENRIVQKIFKCLNK
jgi:glycosyltransferase involved in cell wall biosynthesis